MKKTVNTTKGLVAYFIAFGLYCAVIVFAIVLLIYSILKSNTELLTISISFLVSMPFFFGILLTCNRRVCWIWFENGVLKRKWLLLGKTESISPEKIESVTVARNHIYVFLKKASALCTGCVAWICPKMI